MAPQKQGAQPGQAGQAQTQQHQQKLAAAGCPPAQCASIAAKLPAGVNPDHVAQLATLGPAFNWSLFESLLTQFGPSIIGQLIQLFGVGAGGGGSQPAP